MKNFGEKVIREPERQHDDPKRPTQRTLTLYGLLARHGGRSVAGLLWFAAYHNGTANDWAIANRPFCRPKEYA
jgi:hypothetical protein